MLHLEKSSEIASAISHSHRFLNIPQINVHIRIRKEAGKRALLTPGNDMRLHPGIQGVS